MSESDRILRAMMAREEFTVADLVRACEASPSTVRTVLRRKADYLEEAGVEEASRRGGRWKRYRLLPEAREELTAAFTPQPKPEQVPTDLLAAEELLLSPRAIDADAETRASLLRRARAFRREGEERGDPASPAVESHLGAVDALIDLVEGEATGDAGVLDEVHARIDEMRHSSLAGAELGVSLVHRLEQSPLSALPAPILTTSDRRSPAVAKALVEIARVVAVSQTVAVARAAAAARPAGWEIAARARARSLPASISARAVPSARLGMANRRLAQGEAVVSSLPTRQVS